MKRFFALFLLVLGAVIDASAYEERNFLLETDRNKLAAAVWRTMCSVDPYIKYMNEDGACEEGSTCWRQGSGKLYDYLQLLYDVSGGRVSVFDRPLVRNMGEYIANSCVDKGWMVNSTDASAKEGGDAGLIFRYGKVVGSPFMQAYAREQAGQKLDMPKVDASVPGRILVEVQGQKVCLTYNSRVFKAAVETFGIEDPRISGIWGKEIYRISLESRTMSQKGSYVYRVKAVR